MLMPEKNNKQEQRLGLLIQVTNVISQPTLL